MPRLRPYTPAPQLPYRLQHEGSIVLIHPLTDECNHWLREHTEGIWFGGALVVEPRYVYDLTTALQQEVM